MAMTYEEQRSRIMPRIHLAKNRITALVNDPMLEQLVESRLKAGFNMYGESLFETDMSGLRMDALEEIADAVIYLAQYTALESAAS